MLKALKVSKIEVLDLASQNKEKGMRNSNNQIIIKKAMR